MQPSLQKLLQKRFYDVLSHKYGLCLVVAGLFFTIGNVFMFGEALMQWSRDKYAAIFNNFSDNIGGKSFQDRLCLPVPIDVVYTWVNGSDPELLMNLKKYKLELEKELNVSKSKPDQKEGKCKFSQCVQFRSVVLDPELKGMDNLEDLRKISDVFKDGIQMFKVTYPVDNKVNFTVVTFNIEDQVVKAGNLSHIVIDGQNHTINKAFITSDWTVEHSVLLHDTIIMSGFPHKYTRQQLRDSLPQKYRNGVSKIDLHDEKGLAVLYVPIRTDFDALLELSNLTIEGKSPTMNAANLIWDMSESIHGDVASASRFEDNEELRYSIRSLERFAPWIRHIYIVTNGQIPSWLNMDHPRVTIVTHQEIFVNQSHLPSFSSPAIESHIHRIPGLSDKFIYLNDDVMFGKEVWPDDFYTHSRGQKVYLSWPVPNCQEGCPSNWIRDGYCDKACNNSQCDWDGGDCEGSTSGGGNAGAQSGFFFNNPETSKMYCANGCANNWIADKYCDQSCNVFSCGFDAADCGTENFNKLHRVEFNTDVTEYTINAGEYIFYWNLSSLLVDDAVITEASYNKSDVIRTAAVALKFKVLTVVLNENHNKTKLSFHVKGNRGHETSTFEYNFTAIVDTRSVSKPDKNESHEIAKEGKKDAAVNKTAIMNHTTPEEPPFVFEDVPRDLRLPKKKFDEKLKAADLSAVKGLNLSSVDLPDILQSEWEEAQRQLKEGDITDKGFQRLQVIIQQKLASLKMAGEANKTVHVKPPTVNESAYVPQQPELNDALSRPHRSLLSFNLFANANNNDPAKVYNVGPRFDPNVNYDLQANDTGMRGDNFQPVLLENLFKPGGFKWERFGIFAELQKKKEELFRQKQYVSSGRRSGRSLNQFADSLRHVNKIYNKVFGYSARKVPSHMPHMVDKHVMAELHSSFPEEWDVTSGHRVRSSTDMQFAFSYFYYLMGVTRNTTAAEVFDIMDTDMSRVLSDREIRTLATRLYNLPLDLQTLTSLETVMMNCSKYLPENLQKETPVPPTENYYVSGMPQVTRNLFINCEEIQELLQKNFKPQPVYQYEIVSDDSEVAFKMIKTNVSSVVGQLDDVRKHPKKFICLNDNIDHESEEAKTVKAILVDFYESMFPIPSQFELPADYRNRFLKLDELREWKKYRDWLKFWTNVALVLLVLFAIISFFGDKIEAYQRQFSRRRQAQSTDTSSTEASQPAKKHRVLDV